MARIITKELAIKIVDKLKARKISTRNSAHDEYAVEHGGQIVAVTSIRRGSAKDQGHDHLSKDLHIGPNKAKLLRQCPLSRDGYLQLLREQGLIEDESDSLS